MQNPDGGTSNEKELPERKRDKLKNFSHHDHSTYSISSQANNLPANEPAASAESNPSAKLSADSTRVSSLINAASHVTTSSAIPEAPEPGSGLPSSPQPTVQSLWDAALKKLGTKDQEQLTQASTSSEIDIKRLIELTRGKQKECDGKTWKFHFAGKEIILRDVAEKIVSWLTRFKDFGDIAVNFDPVHGALPWAGVRILLLVLFPYPHQM